MTLPRPISILLRFVIDFTVVTAIVLLVPGIPPDVNFEKYRLGSPIPLYLYYVHVPFGIRNT